MHTLYTKTYLTVMVTGDKMASRRNKVNTITCLYFYPKTRRSPRTLHGSLAEQAVGALVV